MDYRTPKCTHNERGMCVYCLVKRGKLQKAQTKKQMIQQNTKPKCIHPAHMKCLKCIATDKIQIKCQHPDYQQCKNCENYIMYQTFDDYLHSLAANCKHKKPCFKCVPPLSRRTYSIDQTCRNHLPYPQAQCDGCMAPTITVQKQKYSHVSKVRISTSSIFKVSQTKSIGILLGTQADGVIQVKDIYFPEQQDGTSGYINPQNIQKYDQIFNYFNLKQVGIIYSSPHLTSMSLMISSMFQQKYCQIQKQQQISKFVTMRLQYSDFQNNFQPHFECFMVSDQFQAFHKHNLIFQKNSAQASNFDFVTAKQSSNLSSLPTFLREGLQTDFIFFKEIITWIPTIYEQSLFNLNTEYIYPYFSIEKQNLDHLRILLEIDPRQSTEKYRNIQFLLHFAKLIGKPNTQVFLYQFFLDNPDLFLKQKLKDCQKRQKNILNSSKKFMPTNQFRDQYY